MKKALIKIFLILSVGVLAACGVAPQLRSSQVVDAPAKKISTVRIVYREAQWKRVSGNGNVDADAVGFNTFGSRIVASSSQVFVPYGIVTRDGAVLKDGEPLLPMVGATTKPHLLVITPTAANLSQSGKAMWANHVFSCEIIDPNTGKVAWTALIDTKTYRPQFDSAPVATKFDDVYARDFLQTIANRLRNDGFI